MKNKQNVFVMASAVGAAATAFLLLRKRKKEGREKPPKGAPQLRIVNPGNQSEFLTSATESEMG